MFRFFDTVGYRPFVKYQFTSPPTFVSLREGAIVSVTKIDNFQIELANNNDRINEKKSFESLLTSDELKLTKNIFLFFKMALEFRLISDKLRYLN